MPKIKHRQFWVEEGQEKAFFHDDNGVDHDIMEMLAIKMAAIKFVALRGNGAAAQAVVDGAYAKLTALLANVK